MTSPNPPTLPPKFNYKQIQEAARITNEIHRHAKLSPESAAEILTDGPESHEVRQTLLGALQEAKSTFKRNRKPTPKSKHASTVNRRKTKRTRKGHK